MGDKQYIFNLTLVFLLGFFSLSNHSSKTNREMFMEIKKQIITILGSIPQSNKYHFLIKQTWEKAYLHLTHSSQESSSRDFLFQNQNHS